MRRDETEEHEHHTWCQELRPGCLMPEEKPSALQQEHATDNKPELPQIAGRG
jgi:hypothetical protein